MSEKLTMVSVRRLPRLRLRVGGKFFITVGVLVPAVLATAAVGATGLERMAASNHQLYNHSLAVSQHAAAVTVDVLRIQETSLYQVAVTDHQVDAELTAEIDQVLIPRAQQALVVLHGDLGDQAVGRQRFSQMDAGLQQVLTDLSNRAKTAQSASPSARPSSKATARPSPTPSP